MRYELGVHTVMFGVDYPHFESIYPAAKETVQGCLGYLDVPPEEATMILYQNALRAYPAFDAAAIEAKAQEIGFELSELLQPRSGDAGGDVVVGYLRSGHAPMPAAKATRVPAPAP